MTITSTRVVQLDDLLELCKRWDESPDEFARIVDSCRGVFGMSQREMANEFAGRDEKTSSSLESDTGKLEGSDEEKDDEVER